MDVTPDRVANVAVPAAPAAGMLDGVAAAFGMAAIVTILFNTLVAWIKDAFDPLNNLMARLTGHHWITHGLIDVAVFVIVGSVLLRRGYQVSGNALALGLTAAAIVGGGGLTLWFVPF